MSSRSLHVPRPRGFRRSIDRNRIALLWMAEYPLRNGEAWAWWLFGLSGLAGFGSFLAYLGYGYLDSWHGVATLLLLPCFLLGLYRSFHRLAIGESPKSLLAPAMAANWLS